MNNKNFEVSFFDFAIKPALTVVKDLLLLPTALYIIPVAVVVKLMNPKRPLCESKLLDKIC